MRGEGSRREAKYLKTSKAPGEETSEKGFDVKMWIWHDACVQVETVQPVVPAAGKQTGSSHRAEAQVAICPTGQGWGEAGGGTWRKTNKITLILFVLCVVAGINLILIAKLKCLSRIFCRIMFAPSSDELHPYFQSCCIRSYLSLTSCAAAMTEEMLLVSICSRSTWAMGCEARRAERAAFARCMFLQARHSWSPPASCERRRSHSARPMPLQGNPEGWTVSQKLGTSLESHTTDMNPFRSKYRGSIIHLFLRISVSKVLHGGSGSSSYL